MTGYEQDSLTSPRDARECAHAERREREERFAEATPGPRIYSRSELIDYLRQLAKVHDGYEQAVMFRQAADEIAKRDADVFAGRTK